MHVLFTSRCVGEHVGTALATAMPAGGGAGFFLLFLTHLPSSTCRPALHFGTFFGGVDGGGGVLSATDGGGGTGGATTTGGAGAGREPAVSVITSI